jgi:hypothetical protein
MEPHAPDRQPFDERAALEELERLREQIAQRRSERRATGEEFDRFVKSFKKRPSPEVAAEPPPQPAVPSRTGRVHTEGPKPDAPPPSAPDAVGAPASRSRARMLGGGALMLAVAGALAAWTVRHRPPEPAPVSPPARTHSPAAPAPAPAAGQGEIATSRRVWMRVVVDGERVLEREVPADARLPFTAGKTLLIRAGDAGAVRVSIDGRDLGALGRAGEVVTRSFDLRRADQ